MQTESDWLNSLSVGDEVLVITPYDTYTFETITRTTKIIVECKSGRFLRSRGCEVGTVNNWHKTRIHMPKEENKAWIDEKIRGQKANGAYRKFVDDRKFFGLSIKNKEKFVEVIENTMKGFYNEPD